MIPSDHWHDNGDGTAWLLVTDDHADRGERWWDSRRYLSDLDRPCDNQFTHDETWDCPDCIDGRYTFDIEVECGPMPHFHPHEIGCQPIRVSIVPGMVLPIVALSAEGDCDLGDMEPHVCAATYRVGGVDGVDYVVVFDDGTCDYITLPPAAGPGMWAVKVRLAPKNVETPDDEILDELAVNYYLYANRQFVQNTSSKTRAWIDARNTRRENVECRTCGGLGVGHPQCAHTERYWEPCPDCTPENVDTSTEQGHK